MHVQPTTRCSSRAAVVGGWRAPISRDEAAAHVSYCPLLGEFWMLSGRNAGKRCGLNESKGHMRVGILGKTIPAHRLAWLLVTGEWPQGLIDHINGDGTDNRWGNLRLATDAINNQNRAKPQRDNTTSRFLGVCSVSRSPGRFRAQIKVDGRKIHLGTFATEEEAAAAYLAAKRELHPGFVAERFA